MAADDEEPKPKPPIDADLVIAALPGLARVAAASLLRTVSWAVETSALTTQHIAKAVADGEPPTKIVAEATAELRSAVQAALGEMNGNAHEGGATVHTQPGPTVEELRAKGRELLYASADVWLEEVTHPAYARILEEISPDEARILRFLVKEGPQPSVDVRTNRPLGKGSELVAHGLSMIGMQAGVRHINQTKAALNNLERLGLIWFSREQIEDPSRYQLVEVQPDVLEAIARAGRSPKTVHRSVELTAFGTDFCTTCLPLS